MSKKALSVSLSLIMTLVAMFSCFSFVSAESFNDYSDSYSCSVQEDESYDTPEQVAQYLYRYRHLPSNYVTKNQAKEKGWIPKKGNLQEVIPGASIGGDRFSNRQQLVPAGHRWRECDVNYHGGRRGAERLLYDDDCTMVYYTGDHYQTVTLMFNNN